jgi:hypothetical protein
MSELAQRLNITDKSDIKKIENVMQQILIDLEGTVEINDDGQAVYVFDRLYNELKVA